MLGMQTASLSKPSRCSDFKTAFKQLVSGTIIGRVSRAGTARRRPPKLKVRELLMGLVFHCLQGTGTLAENIRVLLRKQLAESSLSERRQNLPWVVFTSLMQAALRPKAMPGNHPQAFYKKWRLVAMDGTVVFGRQHAPNSRLLEQGRIAAQEGGLCQSRDGPAGGAWHS